MRGFLILMFCGFLGVLGIAAPTVAAAQATLRQVPTDDSFVESELRWNGLPGGYAFKMKLLIVDGVIELCGVGTFTNMMSRPAATKMLRGAKLMLNGRSILQDFYFFNKVGSEQLLRNATASCKSSGVRLPRTAEFDIDWPDGDFRG